MKKSYTTIADIIRKGATVNINSDDFRFSELSSLAEIAANNNTALHIKVGDNINAAELSTLATAAGEYLTLDFAD